MPKIQSVNFPDEVFRDLKQIEKETPGCKFSTLVVDLVKRGLDNLRQTQDARHRPKANFSRS